MDTCVSCAQRASLKSAWRVFGRESSWLLAFRELLIARISADESNACGWGAGSGCDGASWSTTTNQSWWRHNAQPIITETPLASSVCCILWFFVLCVERIEVNTTCLDRRVAWNGTLLAWYLRLSIGSRPFLDVSCLAFSNNIISQSQNGRCDARAAVDDVVMLWMVVALATAAKTH